MLSKRKRSTEWPINLKNRTFPPLPTKQNTTFQKKTKEARKKGAAALSQGFISSANTVPRKASDSNVDGLSLITESFRSYRNLNP